MPPVTLTPVLAPRVAPPCVVLVALGVDLPSPVLRRYVLDLALHLTLQPSCFFFLRVLPLTLGAGPLVARPPWYAALACGLVSVLPSA